MKKMLTAFRALGATVDDVDIDADELTREANAEATLLPPAAPKLLKIMGADVEKFAQNTKAGLDAYNERLAVITVELARLELEKCNTETAIKACEAALAVIQPARTAPTYAPGSNVPLYPSGADIPIQRQTLPTAGTSAK